MNEQLNLFEHILKRRPTNNSMLFDIMVEDPRHTTVYVKTRYIIYLYDLMTRREAIAFIELIKESVDWDFYTHSYDSAMFKAFRDQWPETMTATNYNPNF